MNNKVTIVGRTNVGKSLLFNKLTRSKKSIVINKEETTRDINHGYIDYNDKKILINDTGGITNSKNFINKAIKEKINYSLSKSSLILFIVSQEDGFTVLDKEICETLRKKNKNIILVINKTDLTSKDYNQSDFYNLGISDTIEISAKTNKGLNVLLDVIFSKFDQLPVINNKEILYRVSLIGKPNVGKSSLINKILNENIMITSDLPGTTIDSIEIPFEFKKKNYSIYDTAGIFKKSKTITKIQKYSVNTTLETIKRTDICILLLSAEEGVTKQDKIILDKIKKYNKPYIIVINKIDLLNKQEINLLKKEIEYFSKITNKAFILLTSVIKNRNIKKLLELINTITNNLQKRFKSSRLTKILYESTLAHPPPTINNRRIKLKFAQQSKSKELSIYIYGNKVDQLPLSYLKYLQNRYEEELKLPGTPIKISISNEKNPFD
ncbi:MAG: ribosome biogenesis GTPase Der [Gammaproteobacteria bacterium]|nr:ribosome biogenesis GTPase Der [Gammaproteobacteria bacterium]|tara:strand:+ start:231556 stop:232869 length:1314 start_codon:yes stop_codon:yes gene_type:complete